MRPLAFVVVPLFLFACPKPMHKGTPPQVFCPYSKGCENGNNGAFKAGVGAVKVTPRFERPRPDFLSKSGECSEPAPLGSDGKARCGKLTLAAMAEDCGGDRKCPNDQGYVGPDSDGSERDGKPDHFLDCGRDQKCPGDMGYVGPDEDGTEGDGKFQASWIAGFSNTTPAYGVHDDITARAIVVQNGDVSIALVSVDSVGLFLDDVKRIRERVAKKTSTPPDYILVSATHTHEGPDTIGQWGPTNVVPKRGVDDTWLDQVLIEGAAQAVVDALTSARPAKVFSAQAKLGDKTREVIGDTRDPWVSDDTISLLKFTEANGGAIIATLVSYGNHPETLGDTNNFISADYVWALREAVEKGVFKADGTMVKAGAGGTCVFFSGALGGMMTSLGASPKTVDGAQPPGRSYAKTKAVGEIIALAALDGLDTATEEKAPNLAFGANTLELPVDNETFRLSTLPGVDVLRRTIVKFDRFKPITPENTPILITEVAKIQLGGVRFLAVPGELFPELAVGYDSAYAFGNPQIKNTVSPPDLSKAPPPPYLKERLGGEKPVILGLANDELGYLVPEYDYKLHESRPFIERAPGQHYEETNSLGPNTLPALMEHFKLLTGWEPAP